MNDEETPILRALGIAAQYGQTDGDHHKAWVIDQMIRALLGCPMETRSAVDFRGQPYQYEAQSASEDYRDWIAELGEWDEGIPP